MIEVNMFNMFTPVEAFNMWERQSSGLVCLDAWNTVGIEFPIKFAGVTFCLEVDWNLT